MSSHLHGFIFDNNFAIGNESVFTLVDITAGSPLPPPVGFFLEFQGGGVPFLLLNGQNMTLL